MAVTHLLPNKQHGGSWVEAQEASLCIPIVLAVYGRLRAQHHQNQQMCLADKAAIPLEHAFSHHSPYNLLSLARYHCRD